MNAVFCISLAMLFLACKENPEVPVAKPIAKAISRTESLLPAADYPALLTRIHNRKRAWIQRPASDSNLATARLQFFCESFDSVATQWIGTVWDFNGTSEQPRQGFIACGYYVSTVLRDLGFRVQRIRWAQLAAEGIVLKTAPQEIRRYSNRPLSETLADVRTSGKGVYVIGLDNHVGFLYHDGGDIWFVHSSYVGKGTVVKELASGSMVLSHSGYRIVGRIDPAYFFQTR